ncbi:hypothetical protein D9M68_969110 [compost metagenome]
MIVVHELARNRKESSTWLKALLTCWKRPKVRAPAAMDGDMAISGTKLAPCR